MRKRNKIIESGLKLSVLEITAQIESFLKELGVTASVSRDSDKFTVIIPSYTNEDKVDKKELTKKLEKFVQGLDKGLDSCPYIEITVDGIDIYFGDILVNQINESELLLNKTPTCLVCGEKCLHEGHNPFPTHKSLFSKVCDNCYIDIVLPERIDFLKSGSLKKVQEAQDTKEAKKSILSNTVLDSKFIWLFTTYDFDGIEIDENIEFLQEAIDNLIKHDATYLVAFPYVDPNPDDINVDLVFADTPGPVIIYNGEDTEVSKEDLDSLANKQVKKGGK